MWFLLACAGDPDVDSAGDDTGLLDLRADIVDVPEEAFLIVTPDYTIEPGAEVFYCYYGTWTEPTQGINYFEWYQSGEYGHHGMWFGTSESATDYPDGSWEDCTPVEGEPMRDVIPLVQGTAALGPQHGVMDLPEGTAVRVEEGQRWVMHSHYVNSGTRPILVRDVGWGIALAESEVDTWAAGWNVGTAWMSVSPGASETYAATCSFPSAVTLLNIAAHMHDNGVAISLDRQRDGSTERLLEIDEWLDEYTDAPPIKSLEEGAVTALEGDQFTTTCTFFNETDDTLTFPTEMCETMGLAYPLDEPWRCDDSSPEVTGG